MSRQLILCVESNSTARTDYVYIEAVIKHFYIDDRKTKRNPVFMGSKGMYNDKGKIKEINSLIRKFPGESTVIYCIDTDDYDTSPETKVLNDAISEFCKENEYELIFFCKNVEDVFIKRIVSKSEKLRCAETFNRKAMISDADAKKLRCTKPARPCSNILCVLDKYLDRNSVLNN